ncbi:MAG: hypothetical protein IKI72_01575 [Bacteroidales bacterium]|nr:hypothetical protein [Bacteroidales bacterium]
MFPLSSCVNKREIEQKHQYTLKISLFSDRLGSSDGGPKIIEEYSDSAAFVRANEYYERYKEIMRKLNIETADKSYDLSLYADGFDLTDENGKQIFFPELELLEFKNRREGNLMEQNIAYEGASFGMSPEEVMSLPHFKSFIFLKESNSIVNNHELIKSAVYQSSTYKVELCFDDRNKLMRVVFQEEGKIFNSASQFPKGSLDYTENQIRNFRDACQKKYGPPLYKHAIDYPPENTHGNTWAYIWQIGLKKISVGAYIQSNLYHFYAEISQE